MNPDQSREPTRIYITGACDGLDELTYSLAEHPEIELVGRQEHVANAAAALAGGHLGVILHGTRHPSLPADELAAIREHTRTPVVLLASGEASALLEEALEADVIDVLLLPQLTENVVFAARKAAHASRRTPTTSSRQHGRIVTVFSPKGGTGKTVTATNLATALVKHAGKRTLLLDLDLQFGDAAIMLSIEPDRTIQDLMAAPGELDVEKLAGYTLRHTSGVDVLPAPVRPEDAELVTEPKLARLLEVARESYDVIVVDTSPVLPRADAGHARPHRRAAARLRAGGADDQERPAEPPDAGAAFLPAEPDPHGAEPGELERGAEALRGRGGAGDEDQLRAAERPRRAAVGEPRPAGGARGAGRATSPARSRTWRRRSSSRKPRGQPAGAGSPPWRRRRRRCPSTTASGPGRTGTIRAPRARRHSPSPRCSGTRRPSRSRRPTRTAS